jgi:D-sedoheptulose 7-phosphate isomerase
MKEAINGYISDIKDVFLNTKITNKDGGQVDFYVAMDMAAQKIALANSKGNKVIFVGNGGSAAVANHKALDFWFTGRIRGTSFSDSSLLTCVANDFGYAQVFAKPINMFADKGDILVAISSSGNSQNIIEAAEEARRRGCEIFTFSGFKEGNRLRQIGDLNFYTPVNHFNKIESAHLLLCDCILEIIVKHKERFVQCNEHGQEKKALVVLDRDGTMNYDDGFFGRYDNWKDELKIYSGVPEGIKKLNSRAKVVVATNQLGVARGFLTAGRVEDVNKAINSYIAENGGKINGWYYCPFVEKEWAMKEGISQSSPWVLEKDPEFRKPNIGMIKKAAEDLGFALSDFTDVYVIGDKAQDVQMAINAGGKGILIKNGKNDGEILKTRELAVKYNDRIKFADNFLEASDLVIKDIELI